MSMINRFTCYNPPATQLSTMSCWPIFLGKVGNICGNLWAFWVSRWVAKEDSGPWTTLSLIPDAEWGQLCIWYQRQSLTQNENTDEVIDMVLQQFITSQKEKPSGSCITNQNQLTLYLGTGLLYRSDFQKCTEEQKQVHPQADVSNLQVSTLTCYLLFLTNHSLILVNI